MTDSLSISRAFGAGLKRELLIYFRHKGDLANPLIFYLMVVVFIPLGISKDPLIMSKIAPGMLWVIALLATLLSLDGLFRSDFEDGSLEQLVLSPQPLSMMVLTKVAVHWLLTGIPLTLFAPVLGAMLSLPSEGYAVLILSLLIGTGSLSLIGSIGAALTVGLRKGGLLLSLVIMPFYVPVLIFGATAVKNTIEGFPAAAELAILGIMLVLWLVLAPFAIAGGLKISVRA